MKQNKFGVYGILFQKKLAGAFISRDMTNAKLKFEAEIYREPKPENFELRCLGMYSYEQKRIIPTDIYIIGGYEAVNYRHTTEDLNEIMKVKSIAKDVSERNVKNEEIIVRLFDGVKLNEN